MPGSSKWSLSFTFPHQNPVHASPLPIRATCPTQLISLNLITRTILGENYKAFSSTLCSFLHSPVTSSLLGPNNLLNTKFSNILMLRSSLSVSDQVSHPNTTGNIVFFTTNQCTNIYQTGRFIMFSVATNVYKKKTKGPTLMESFTMQNTGPNPFNVIFSG